MKLAGSFPDVQVWILSQNLIGRLKINMAPPRNFRNKIKCKGFDWLTDWSKIKGRFCVLIIFYDWLSNIESRQMRYFRVTVIYITCLFLSFYNFFVVEYLRLHWLSNKPHFLTNVKPGYAKVNVFCPGN